MLRPLFNKSCWRNSKCLPLKIIGILLVFTILHVFLVRIYPPEGYVRQSQTSRRTNKNGISSSEDGASLGNGSQIITGFIKTWINQDDLPDEDYEVTQEETTRKLLPEVDLGSADDRIFNGPPHSDLISSSKSIYSESLQTKRLCTVPITLPEELQKRRDQARSACKRLRKDLPIRWRRRDRGPSSGMLSKLRWDQKHHLLYCHLPKVASTTWAWHLLRVTGLKDEEIAAHRNVHILLQERLSPPTPENFDSGFLKYALSFLVSRHPFHRLVSAYKNKIVEAEKRRQHYVDLRKTILEKYHSSGSTSDEMPSFRDFCQYIADSTEAWLADLDHIPPPDLHWMPMTYVCSPCNLRYDVFSKLETMESDTRFIASQCGLSDIIRTETLMNPSLQEEEEENSHDSKNSVIQNFSLPMENIKYSSRLDDSAKSPDMENEYKNLTSLSIKDSDAKDVTKTGSKTYPEYIKELSSEEMERLYQIYRFDFEIFGYDVNDYR
ncbi:hypothetical protein SK128_024291 [Halocaridina rubra]|uniref:Carbohydrate sulfotransferase n=1 Tax=Halocaridina rubra TaxID=373956 RepID=A0AAN8ZV86_HALRR